MQFLGSGHEAAKLMQFQDVILCVPIRRLTVAAIISFFCINRRGLKRKGAAF